MIRSMRLVWVVLLLALGCGAGATAQAPAPRAEPIAGHTDPQPTAPGSSAPLIADLRVELPFNEPLVRLVWGGQVLAQQHFVLDMCARAGDRTRDGYCAFLGWKVASDLDHALDRYLGIRRRWMDAAKASRAAAGADDDRMFVDMLPPS